MTTSVIDRPVGAVRPRGASWRAACLIALAFAVVQPASTARADGPLEWIEDLFTWPPFGIGRKTPDGPRAPYRPALEFKGPKRLEGRIKDVASLFTERKKPPATLVGVEFRARDDVETVRKLLRSEGYFASRINWRIGDGKPATATLVVDAGPKYTVRQARIVDGTGSTARFAGIERPKPGARYDADTILKTEAGIIANLKSRGYAFAKIDSRRIVVDHRIRQVTVTWTVAPNKVIRFGDVRIQGAPGVDHGLVRRRIAWKRGQVWNAKLVAETEDRLRTLDVFGSIQIRPDERSIGADGVTPVLVILTERKRRTIGASVYYDSSIGPGAEVEWLHRNLFGGAESFQIKLIGSQQVFGAQSFFRKPDVFGGAEDFLAAARFQEFRTDAYDGREGVVGLFLSRQFGRYLTLKAGPLFDWSEQEQLGVTNDYLLGGFDVEANYDRANDLLDPTEGYRLKLNVTPYFGEDLTFTRAFLRGSAYVTPFRQKRLTIAAWSRVGVVFGADLGDLPPNKKIYAGGGGSIRGYGSQRVGPRDTSNDPSGGRSLIEGGLELRFRFDRSWGAVAFVEAGNVFESITPAFSDGIRVGVGVGVRYRSPIGLLRLDIATPVNRRRGDSYIQFYISIGQAF